MLKFSNTENQKNTELIKIVSLLVHAAKIDENYTNKERDLIINFINDFSKENQQINKSSEVLEESEKYEKDSNHILEFTKEIKKMDLKIKTSILKTLWQIVLSDNKSGIFESNLIRRVCGLLYIPDKVSGEIKLSLINENK